MSLARRRSRLAGDDFFATGLSRSVDLSLIMTTMVMGLVVVNRRPDHGRYIQFTIQHAGPGVLAKCPPTVRNNLGLALRSQAGVAIGLALSSSTRFAELGPRGEDLANWC